MRSAAELGGEAHGCAPSRVVQVARLRARRPVCRRCCWRRVEANLERAASFPAPIASPSIAKVGSRRRDRVRGATVAAGFRSDLGWRPTAAGSRESIEGTHGPPTVDGRRCAARPGFRHRGFELVNAEAGPPVTGMTGDRRDGRPTDERRGAPSSSIVDDQPSLFLSGGASRAGQTSSSWWAARSEGGRPPSSLVRRSAAPNVVLRRRSTCRRAVARRGDPRSADDPSRQRASPRAQRLGLAPTT